jgi:hypothetical protein
MNFISREQVIAIIKEFGWAEGSGEILRRVEALFSFPAPNPDGKDGRNVMGQTEDEFWAAVERQDK